MLCYKALNVWLFYQLQHQKLHGTLTNPIQVNTRLLSTKQSRKLNPLWECTVAKNYVSSCSFGYSMICLECVLNHNLTQVSRLMSCPTWSGMELYVCLLGTISHQGKPTSTFILYINISLLLNLDLFHQR